MAVAAVACILIAGAVRAVLPGDTFTVAWAHSVQRSQWEERYRVLPDALVLDEARVQGSGAGMEAGEHAVLRDGWWTWQPRQRFPSITLTVSSFTGDYRICTVARCAALRELAGTTTEGAAVEIAPCPT
jgi:hypothetical protein